MIPEKNWKWYGSPAHFICSRWCRFHLATEIGDYIISTVGEYVHPRHSNGNETMETDWLENNWPGEDIGYGRKYETMVFKTTGKRCDNKKCGCDLPKHDGADIDFAAYNTAGDATAGHMDLCYKWAKEQSEK